MKDFINNVKLNLIAKSLMANGVVKNVKLKVGGNRLLIGEVSFSDKEAGGKFIMNFDKVSGGNLEASGDHDFAIMVKDLQILGDKGEEFSMESLELSSIAEAVELFASVMK